jgi:hypothetical protein
VTGGPPNPEGGPKSMKAPEWNDSLLVEHRDSMDSSGGRDAYDLLTRAAQELTAYAMRSDMARGRANL